MRTPFFSAFLIALVLHVVGLAVLSFGWQVWRVPLPLPQPPSTTLIAVVSVSEPTPPLQPPSPPEAIPTPSVDSAPEPTPATPPLSAPLTLPKQVEPTPPKRVETRPQPAPRPTPAAPARRETRPSPPPGVLSEPMGSAGRGPDGASSAPAQQTSQRPPPAEGADVSRLFAHGDVPVASGASSSDKGGPEQGGSGGSGEGDGTKGGSTRASAGGGPGTGRGGAGSGSGTGGGGGSGTSARPIGGYQVKPRYPESARRRGIEGITLLKMRITAQGSVEDVQVERSAGHPDLDESAIEAVRRWRFDPARRAGAPVAVWVLIPVEFKLQ